MHTYITAAYTPIIGKFVHLHLTQDMPVASIGIIGTERWNYSMDIITDKITVTMDAALPCQIGTQSLNLTDIWFLIHSTEIFSFWLC